MSRPIPVNLVTGFLGVGKTTAIRHLLARHPSHERWAVLVNEFGEIGVDGALLSEPGIAIEEVAGGCLCCVAAPAFTTGLNRLIRQHRPDRILIEPSGLGHPAQVLETLRGPLYAGVLEPRATLCLMDARHLASPRHREHPNFQDPIHLADVLVANKRDLCSTQDLEAFEDFAAALNPAKAGLGCVELGRVDPAWLDLACPTGRRARFPGAHASLVETATMEPQTEASGDWLQIDGHADGYHRAGWRIVQRRRWSKDALDRLWAALGVERKKGLFETDLGWVAYNQDHDSPIAAPTDGRARLELIDHTPPDSPTIDTRLQELDGRSGTD